MVSLCACIYGRHATEQSNVVNSLIQLREKHVVCLSVELQQIECTLTDDITHLVAVRNKNILCHSFQLFFSCATLATLQSGVLLMSGVRLLVVKASITG